MNESPQYLTWFTRALIYTLLAVNLFLAAGIAYQGGVIQQQQVLIKVLWRDCR